MAKFRDQDFRVNDEVFYIERRGVYHLLEIDSIRENDNCPVVIYTMDGTLTFTADGKFAEFDSYQSLFHADALTFDEYERLTHINYNYIKPRNT